MTHGHVRACAHASYIHYAVAYMRMHVHTAGIRAGDCFDRCVGRIGIFQRNKPHGLGRDKVERHDSREVVQVEGHLNWTKAVRNRRVVLGVAKALTREALAECVRFFSKKW